MPAYGLNPSGIGGSSRISVMVTRRLAAMLSGIWVRTDIAPHKKGPRLIPPTPRSRPWCRPCGFPYGLKPSGIGGSSRISVMVMRRLAAM